MPEPVCACGQPLATHGRTCPPKPTSGHQAPDPEPVDHLPTTLPPGTSYALIKAALDTMGPPVSDPLAAAGRTEQTTRQTHHQAMQHRNQLIRQAIQNGRTLREVGEAVGLSHVAVRNIAEKETKP